MNDSRQELKAIQDYLKRKAPRKLDERPIYYVYQHYNNRPERGELGCRWIGKGHSNRAYHIGRNVHWDAIFSKEFPPEVLFVAENLTEEEAFEIEKWMIAVARAAGVKLCNMSEGGEGGAAGYHPKLEIRMKIAAALRGKHLSDEHRQNLSLAAKNRKAPSHTTKHTTVTRQKMSESQKKRPRNPHSDETKRKISDAAKNMSLDHRQKLSLAAIENWKRQKELGERSRA